MKIESALALAQDLARRGMYVFPLGRNKAPAIPAGQDGGNGVHSATTDAERIAFLFNKASQVSSVLHVGLHTGASGFLVLDVDDVCKMRCKGGSYCKPEHPKFDDECSWVTECRLEGQGRHGHHGSDQLVAWENLHGALPRTPVTRTPSGGRHLWFKMPEEKVGNAKFGGLTAVDVRGYGGQVVAPGVTNVQGKKYEWIDSWEFGQAPGLPEVLKEQLGKASQRGIENDLDKLDPITRKHFEYLRTLGWVPAGSQAMKKGTDWDEVGDRQDAWHIDLSHPCHASFPSVCASLGQRNPGRLKVFTETWAAGPNGEFFPTNQVYRQEEVERFVKMGSTELQIKGKGPEVVQKRVVGKGRLRAALLDLDSIEDVRPPEWLIEGWLPRGALAQLYAASGVGKTFLAIDWMMHIATGTDWQGCKVKKSEKVMYVIAEGAAGFGMRTKAWRQEHADLATEDVTLLPLAVNLVSSEEMDELLEIVEERKPQLVVIDTLAKSSVGADENSNKDMGVVINNAMQIQEASPGCTVLLLHHTGHTNQDRARGASALYAAMDASYRLDGGTRNGLTLTSDKQKEAEQPHPIRLNTRKVDLVGTSDSLGNMRNSLVIAGGEDVEGEEERDEGPTAPRQALQIADVLWRMSNHRAANKDWMAKTGMASGMFSKWKTVAEELGLVRKTGNNKFDPWEATCDPYGSYGKEPITVKMSHREASA